MKSPKIISDWAWTLTHPQYWLEPVQMYLADRRRAKREAIINAYRASKTVHSFR